jgi:cytochrome P450
MTKGSSASSDTPQPLPGPTGLDWIRVLRNVLGTELVETLQYLREEYGPVAKFINPADRERIVLLADPDGIQHVLETNQGNYPKPESFDEQLDDLFGQGLLTSSGDLWLRQNRLISPMFTKESIYSFTEIVREETEAMLHRWADHEAQIDLHEEMKRVTLLIIGRALFSTDMEAHVGEIGENLEALLGGFHRRTTGPQQVLPDWMQRGAIRREQAALETIDGIVDELIEERRGNADAYDDLLSKLILAQDEETGDEMSDQQIRDEIRTFLLAGHETTATALTWTWYLLAQAPAVHGDLHEQVSSSEALSRDEITPQIVTDLQYVTQCVQEGMRIYPPVPLIARAAETTDTVCGYRIPAGFEVLTPQFVVHRDPDIWDQPLEYRPERFAPDAGDDRPAYAYFPFGGGARMCTGRQFALMEAQLILARVVSEYRLELHSPAPDESIGYNTTITMTPDRPIEMTVERWDADR